jgi:hypothetical protein
LSSWDRLITAILQATEVSANATAAATSALVDRLDISAGPAGPAGADGTPLSVPPSGCYQVTNLYVNENGKLEIKYSDTPAP